MATGARGSGSRGNAELEEHLLALAHGNRSLDIDPGLFVAATRHDTLRISEINILDLVPWYQTSRSVVDYVEEQPVVDTGFSDPNVSHYEARKQPLVAISVHGEIRGVHSPDMLPEVGESLLVQLRLKLCRQIVGGRGAEHGELLGTLNVPPAQRLHVGDPSILSVAAAVTRAHSNGDEFPTLVALNFEDRRKMISPPIAWEIPLISCRTVPAGTMVTGCYVPHAELHIGSVRVRVGDENAEGSRRVVSEAEVALVHLRPAAFVVANFGTRTEAGLDQNQPDSLSDVTEEEWQEFDRIVSRRRD